MKLGNNRGIKTGLWFSNEIFRDSDINAVGKNTYLNMTDTLGAQHRDLIEQSKDVVIGGLLLEHDSLLTTKLRAGLAISSQGAYLVDDSWGFSADPGALFMVVVPVDTNVAFNSGGTDDRIDTVEIRPIETEYNDSPRNFKDPVTGLVTTAVTPTRKEYGFEFAVREGTEDPSPVAPSRTSGWIKIAEVYVASGVSSITQSDIKDVRYSDTWTTDSETTVEPFRAVVSAGQTVLDFSKHSKVLIKGGVVSQGTGDTLDISALVSYITEEYGTVYRVETEDQTNMTIGSATLDGSTLNYVKLSEGVAGSFGFVVDSSVPTAYEILLATFIGSTGGTFRVFDQRFKNILRKPTGSISFVSTSGVISLAANPSTVLERSGAWCAGSYIWVADGGNDKLVVYVWETTVNAITLTEVAEIGSLNLPATVEVVRIKDNVCVMLGYDYDKIQAFEFDPTVPSISALGSPITLSGGASALQDTRMASARNGLDFIWTDTTGGQGTMSLYRLEGSTLVELAANTSIGASGCAVVALDPIHFVTFDFDDDDTLQMWEFDGQSLNRLGSSYDPFSDYAATPSGPFLTPISNTDVWVSSFILFLTEGLSGKQLRFNFETFEWVVVLTNLPGEISGFGWPPIGGLGSAYLHCYGSTTELIRVYRGDPPDLL